MQIVNAYCEKLLDFEVPLEDVCLENDVHPALKNLFEVAFKSITTSGFSIKAVTSSSLQGSLSERFLLRDQLLAVGYFSGDEASCGAYLWLIRHFLGLLPLPLLPTKTNSQRLSWRFLCEFCKKLLDEPCSDICSTYCYSIARYMNALANANRMLLLNLMSFLSSLISNENDTTCLANYFASALFIRPYYPGTGIKFCRDGYYFLIFLMVHWDRLGRLCKTPKGFEVQTFKNRRIRFTKITRTSFPLMERERNVYHDVLLDFEKKLSYNKATQTTQQLSRSVSDLSIRVSKCSSAHPRVTNEINEENNEEENVKKFTPPQTKISKDDNAMPALSGEDEYFYDEDFKEQADDSTLERIAKVGWTYTPSVASPRIGWNINKNNYNLTFDNNESEGEAKSPEITTPMSAAEEQPSEKRSQKSIISLQSIQSKLKFLKKMRPSLCSAKKSSSTEDAPTKIKYKKMHSSRNNSF